MVLFDIVYLGFGLSAGLEFASVLLFGLPIAGITGVTGWVLLRAPLVTVPQTPPPR